MGESQSETLRASLYSLLAPPLQGTGDLVGGSMTLNPGWTGWPSLSLSCLEAVQEGPGLSYIPCPDRENPRVRTSRDSMKVTLLPRAFLSLPAMDV